MDKSKRLNAEGSKNRGRPEIIGTLFFAFESPGTANHLKKGRSAKNSLISAKCEEQE
jgi:hypothetical protein